MFNRRATLFMRYCVRFYFELFFQTDASYMSLFLTSHLPTIQRNLLQDVYCIHVFPFLGFHTKDFFTMLYYTPTGLFRNKVFLSGSFTGMFVHSKSAVIQIDGSVFKDQSLNFSFLFGFMFKMLQISCLICLVKWSSSCVCLPYVIKDLLNKYVYLLFRSQRLCKLVTIQ